MADAERVRQILAAADWHHVGMQPCDVECVFPGKYLVPYLTKLGPVGMALRDVDEHTRQRVVAAVRSAFDPWVRGAEVRFTAACWMLAATTS
jgi:hypothetical protein